MSRFREAVSSMRHTTFDPEVEFDGCPKWEQLGRTSLEEFFYGNIMPFSKYRKILR